MAEKVFLQHTGGPGKSPEAAWAFGAAEVATGGRLKADGNGIAPLNGLFTQFAKLVAAPHFGGIPQAAWGKFGKKVKGIVEVEVHSLRFKFQETMFKTGHFTVVACA